ncbi:hypothetical protein WN944_000027 [Citrus x changshan-huyou]|uniref:Protein kinase domain-containing protein n=1 Tax=Citrus x changshan-huyou TaxID=2935761 RepID=A0AAP0MID6_9ROSI
MIQHRPYTQKVDVYSFGIVLWELITGLLPFQNMTAVQAAFAVVNKGVRPVIPNDCLPVLSEIMTRCWDTNPEVRPPFTEIVRMLENAETEIMTTRGRGAEGQRQTLTSIADASMNSAVYWGHPFCRSGKTRVLGTSSKHVRLVLLSQQLLLPSLQPK